MTLKKFLQPFLSEKGFMIRGLMVLVILVVMLWQVHTLKAQEIQIAQMLQKRSAMENKSPIVVPPPVTPVAVKKAPVSVKEYVLEGTILQDGIIHALIDGSIYMTGDRLDDYIVDNVSMEKTTLRHASSEDVRTLVFANADLDVISQ